MLEALKPNWQSGVTETLEYRTEVLESQNGRESRIARRTLPRRTLSFRSTLSNQEAWDMSARLRTAFGSQVSIGDYTNLVGIVTQPLGAGWTAFRTLLWETPSMEMVLVDRNGAVPLRLWGTTPLGSFSDGFDSGYERIGHYTRLNCLDALPRPVEAGARIYHITEGYPLDSFDMRYVTDSLVDVAVSAQVFDYTPSYTPTTLPMPGGYPALHVKPNWAGGVDFSHVTPFNSVDYGDTVFRRYRNFNLERHLRSYNFSVNQEDARRILTLFMACKGRQGDFFVPSWTSDLTPMSGVGLASPNVIVPDHINEILTEWPNLALTFVLHNGAVFTRRITGVSPYVEGAVAFDAGFDEGFDSAIGGQNVIVNLESNLTRVVSRREIAMICFTPLCRFASDTLTVNWIHHNLASVKINVQSIDA